MCDISLRYCQDIGEISWEQGMIFYDSHLFYFCTALAGTITSLTLGHSFHKTAHEKERFYSGPFQLFSPNLGTLSPKVSANINQDFIYLSHFTILNSVNSFHQMSIFCQLDTVWQHTRRLYQKSVYYLHEGLFDFIYFLVNFFCLDIYFLLTNFHENLQQWRRWYR